MTVVVAPAPAEAALETALAGLIADQIQTGQLYLRDRPRARNLTMVDEVPDTDETKMVVETTVGRTDRPGSLHIRIRLSDSNGNYFSPGYTIPIQFNVVERLKQRGWPIDRLTNIPTEWGFLTVALPPIR